MSTKPMVRKARVMNVFPAALRCIKGMGCTRRWLLGLILAATGTPKFIMGGVAPNFIEWANGPGAGKG